MPIPRDPKENLNLARGIAIPIEIGGRDRAGRLGRDEKAVGGGSRETSPSEETAVVSTRERDALEHGPQGGKLTSGGSG